MIQRRRYSSYVIMWMTTALLLPGVLAQTLTYGAGVLSNLVIALATALVCEAIYLNTAIVPALRALRRPDGAAALTGALVALALPPAMPASLVAFGVLVALGLGKYAYGGLGNNPFNPAMVGYAVLLVSFPELLAQWPTTGIDSLSGATPLDALAHRDASTWREFEATGVVGRIGGHGSEAINLGYTLGGMGLLALRLIHWRIPCAVLTGIALAAAVGHDNGSSASAGSPLFHLFTGASALTAWFIATDPVSSPSHPLAQWLYGLLIGVLLFVLRAYASYPDGAAFAVLLANGTAPWLQQRCNTLDQRRRLRREARS